MEFCDLHRQRDRIRERLNQRMEKVLQETKFILGPEVEELESSLARFVGVPHAITVANGTDALQIALRALGVGPGAEVITPSFSFFATVEACLLVGARPIFVDINPATYTMDVNRLAEAVTPRTRAIITVSLYGQCSEMDAIAEVAQAHDLPVIEDAAQSFGATYRGRRSCSLSRLACTSFFPSKPLGCYGDGGAVFTADDSLATRVKRIRAHGQSKRYYHAECGTNSRLDTLQAAVLLAKLEIFEDELKRREEIACQYSKGLSGLIQIPQILSTNRSAWAQYTVRHAERDLLAEFLKQRGIPTSIHYPLPLHQQPALIASGAIRLPESEKAAREVLSLPMHPYLTEEEQGQVIGAIADFSGGAR